jgi:hypothetical protein
VSLSGGFSRKQAIFSRNQTYRVSAGSRLVSDFGEKEYFYRPGVLPSQG